MGELVRPLVPAKTNLIKRAHAIKPFKSIADLGACWGVNGGYTFFALDQYPLERAHLVDVRITDVTRAKAGAYRNLVLHQADFRQPRVAAEIGPVDAVFLFDILVHQANPDWDDLLRTYAPQTEMFLLFHQSFTASRKTVRLLDLGLEEYLRQTPYKYANDSEKIERWFRTLDEMNPRFGVRNRDIPGFWQWGVTDRDLIMLMWSLGFEVEYMENYGGWPQLPSFENHGFIFCKRQTVETMAGTREATLAARFSA
ncbi:MAG TPA: class I SAM-dependent methyltransferase [Methylomirabilota bacterium]|nr:class I SAM-dependent methyltransferase [Methylomirabilota bacterium]